MTDRVIEIVRRTTAAPAAVWAVLSGLDQWQEWLPTVTSSRREGAAGPIGPGTAYVLDQPRLPRTRWVVTDWHPGTSFTWRSRRPGVGSTADHIVTATEDGGSTITLRMTWSGPLAGLTAMLYGAMTRKYLDLEARALAERVQATSGQGPTSDTGSGKGSGKGSDKGSGTAA